MGLESVNYQCPACGGPLRYDGAKGHLVCEHCESEFEVAEVEAAYAAKQESEATKVTTAPAQELDYGYVCSSCGAELLTDGTTAVSECPYCGNPVVMASNLAGALKPDLVIPFKLDHNAAVTALQEHYKGKPLLPKSFKASNRINEVQGVYVPFWLYDAHASGSAQFEATSDSTHYSGNDEIIETAHYDVYRSGNMDFEAVPVDGSTKMPDGHMDAIEPFNYDELVPFSVAYMPGYVANRWDEDAEQCRARAENRMAASVESALGKTVTGYDSVNCTSSDVHCDWKAERYAMLPVWMLHTSWEGTDYLFAMNGQTGRLIGDLPVSKPKLFAFSAAAFALMFALMAWLYPAPEGWFDWLMRLGVPALVTFVVAMLLLAPMRTAQEATHADTYLDTASFELTGKTDTYTHTTRRVIHHDNDDN